MTNLWHLVNRFWWNATAILDFFLSTIYSLNTTGSNDKIVTLEKTTMIPFPFNENRFSFFVTDHLLVGQLCSNPKSNRSLLSFLKVTQCSTSEIGDAPLYNSCSLSIQVMTTGPLPAPSKCKSGRFNAWEHSSTHRTTLWRWWSGRTPSKRPGPRSSSKRSRQSLMKLPSGQFGRFRRLTHNCECMCEGGLEV